MSHQVENGVLITKDIQELDSIGINEDGTAFIAPLKINTTITERLYGLFVQSAGIQTDSRKLRKGEIFFALKGENFNGNQYAAAALAAGALAVVVDEAVEGVGEEQCVVVEDVLRTLQELAHYHRKQLGLRMLAITGTNGKTTTKELTSAVLSRGFRTACTVGNLNNHIGVPLTLLSMNARRTFSLL